MGITRGWPDSLTYDATQRRLTTADGFFTSGHNRAISVQRSTSDQLAAATIGTTETAFASTVVFPANYFIANKAVLVIVGLEIVAGNPTNTMLFKLRVQKAGPTNVNLWVQGAAASSVVGATQGQYGFAFILQGTAAPGASVGLECQPAHAFTNFQSSFIGTVAQAPNVDTASQQTMQLTVTFGGSNTGHTVNLRQLVASEMN